MVHCVVLLLTALYVAMYCINFLLGTAEQINK